MSDRTLRRNLKTLKNQGVIDSIELDNGGLFYGFPNVTCDPIIRSAAMASRGARGGATIATKRPLHTVTPDQMIEGLRKAKENPVIRPTGRSAKQRRAQLKAYITSINWQIDDLQQVIAKREQEKRRQEIESVYSKNQDDGQST